MPVGISGGFLSRNGFIACSCGIFARSELRPLLGSRGSGGSPPGTSSNRDASPVSSWGATRGLHPPAPPSDDSASGRLGGYLPQLDGLRGLAILAVVFHHFGFHLLHGWTGDQWAERLLLAQRYLITLSLWKLQDKTDSGLGAFVG